MSGLLRKFLDGWTEWVQPSTWDDDYRTLDLQGRLHLAELNEKAAWSEVHRTAGERDKALRAISEMRAHPSSQPAVAAPAAPEQPKTVLADAIANSHLRERNDLLEAEVEHYRGKAQEFAHRLTQRGEPTTLIEYGETVA